MPETSRKIIRYEAGQSLPDDDHVAIEQPLEIRLRNQSLSVTMRTPGHDNELAAGFLLGEGLVNSKTDILSIDPCAFDREGNVINVKPSPSLKIDFEKLTRHVFASSSCGVCGKASIDAIHQLFPPINSDLKVTAAKVLSLPEKLRAAQVTFDQTGGLHAAALFDRAGNLLIAREDIGRHNAVDKVLGWALLQNHLPLSQHMLLVSGRASFEIMQKALAARIAIVAAISAPSSLAIDFAEESDQTLIGFLRPGRMNIYSHEHRIRFD